MDHSFGVTNKKYLLNPRSPYFLLYLLSELLKFAFYFWGDEQFVLIFAGVTYVQGSFAYFGCISSYTFYVSVENYSLVFSFTYKNLTERIIEKTNFSIDLPLDLPPELFCFYVYIYFLIIYFMLLIYLPILMLVPHSLSNV